MQLTDIPVKMITPWATDAGPSYVRVVPVDSQIGIDDGAASFETGFPPLNFTPVGAGGVPPFGQDMNGIFNVTTAWLRWTQAGGPAYFDALFAADIGGYPIGAFLQSAVTPGSFFISLINNNLNNPDSITTGWLAFPGTSIKFPSRIVTNNATVNLNCDTDYSLGLNRSGPAAMTVNLAAAGTLATNQVFEIADLSGNVDLGVVTVVPPGGHTIAGAASFTMNVAKSVPQFKYYGSSIWSVRA
jgi:hypothetical protein